jgi:transporter family protein
MRGVFGWALPLAGTVLFYGLAGGVYKQAAITFGQFCLLFVAVKVVVNLSAWALAGRRSLFEPESRQFVKFAMLGQLINGVAWMFYFLAFSMPDSSAAIVQTVTAAYTAFAVVLALLFLRERLAVWQGLGVALVIAAGLILGGSGQTGSTEFRLGWFGASLITLFCWGVAVVLFKHAYNQPGADDYRLFVTNVIGMAVILGPYGLYDLSRTPPDWSPGSLGLGLVVVTLYALGDLTLFAAIGRGPAAIVSPLSGLYPLPTILYAFLVLKETITVPQQWAMLMCLVAIPLVAISPAPTRTEAEAEAAAGP